MSGRYQAEPLRAELSPAQQADHLARRKEVWEAIQNTDANCATIRGPGQPRQFASETASATGVHKSTINRDIARAEALGPDLRVIAEAVVVGGGAFQ